MKEPLIEELLDPVLRDLDLDLEAVDVVPAGRRRVLRVVVDGDGPDGRGPTLDDIADATRAISLALDTSAAESADGMGSSPYTLEVSSRGVGRALELPRHWRRNAGRLVALTTTGGDRVTGRIRSSDEEAVVLEVDGTDRRLPYAELTKAQVQVELNRPSGADQPDDGDQPDDTDEEA